MLPVAMARSSYDDLSVRKNFYMSVEKKLYWLDMAINNL